MTEIRLQIDGMHCASCPLLVDDCLEDLAGVTESRTDLRTGLCVVKADKPVSVDDLIAAVASAGYTAKVISSN